MHKFLLFLLLPLFFGCDGNTAQRKADRGDNHVPDPNRVYFKNVKSRNYQEKEVADGTTAYYHNKLSDLTSPLRPVIVDNWLEGEAKLVFQTKEGDYFNGRVEVEHPEYGWLEVYINEVNGLKEFSHHLSANRTLRTVAGETEQDLFPDTDDRPVFYEVIRDYGELTN